MKKSIEYTIVFLIGGTIYSLVEVIFRNHTHWSMFFAGGISFFALYMIYFRLSKLSLFLKCLAGAVTVTAVEFLFGIILNVIFKMGIWNYSFLEYNILGQICPKYTLFWFILCMPAFLLCRVIKNNISKNNNTHL